MGVSGPPGGGWAVDVGVPPGGPGPAWVGGGCLRWGGIAALVLRRWAGAKCPCGCGDSVTLGVSAGVASGGGGAGSGERASPDRGVHGRARRRGGTIPRYLCLMLSV